jgi:hypothetical protein
MSPEVISRLLYGPEVDGELNQSDGSRILELNFLLFVSLVSWNNGDRDD